MFKLKHSIYALLGTALFYASCSNKAEQAVAPTIANEQLTSAGLKLTNQADPSDAPSCLYRFHLDNKGNVTSTDSTSLNLKANAKYNVQVVMLDTTQTPTFDVAAEIKDRANYHLFFFQPTPVAQQSLVFGNTSPYIPGTAPSATGPYLNLSVARTDQDTNNPPLQVGLADVFTTGAASTGKLRVVLRHQPNAKNGTFDPGSSDLDVNFIVNIK